MFQINAGHKKEIAVKIYQLLRFGQLSPNWKLHTVGSYTTDASSNSDFLSRMYTSSTIVNMGQLRVNKSEGVLLAQSNFEACLTGEDCAFSGHIHAWGLRPFNVRWPSTDSLIHVCHHHGKKHMAFYGLHAPDGATWVVCMLILHLLYHSLCFRVCRSHSTGGSTINNRTYCTHAHIIAEH